MEKIERQAKHQRLIKLDKFKIRSIGLNCNCIYKIILFMSKSVNCKGIFDLLNLFFSKIMKTIYST